MRKLIVTGIRAYQVAISPYLPPVCRFDPTCSDYAAQAIVRHGVWRGSLRALRRVFRCHPFARFGYDPVD